MPTVLLGRTSSSGITSDFFGSGNTAIWPFTAVASGNLHMIYCQHKRAAGNPSATDCMLGIYADSAGSPGALLGAAQASNGVFFGVADANAVFGANLVPTVAIVSGTAYWLGIWAVDASDSQFNFVGDTGGSYRETLGASKFPDPWPGGSTSSVDIVIWGEDTPAAPSPELEDHTCFPVYKLRPPDYGYLSR